MAERDSLNADSFNSLLGSGIFLKWRADVPLTLRVLTTDPIVSEAEFTNKQTGEITLRTQFAFIVYNFTEEKAQVMRATPTIARWIGDKHHDADFGANIRQVDIKVTPSGEGLERRYDLQVLPKPRALTQAMIDEARAIDLDNIVKDSKGRMSQLVQSKENEDVGNMAAPVGTSGYDKAKAQAAALKKPEPTSEPEDNLPADALDEIAPVEDEPINLDDIPF